MAPIRQLKHGMLTELWAQPIPHFVFAINELPSAPFSPGNQQTESLPLPSSSDETIKQRLKKKEEFREEGVLSGNEYQDKRQEILREL